MAVAAFLGVLLQDIPAGLVLVSTALLAGAVALARHAAMRSLETSKTVCVLFFWLAAAHIFFGFLMAGLTTEHISVRSNAQAFYANAMLIDSIGLFAGAVGYRWKLDGKARGLPRVMPILVDVDLAEKLLKMLLLSGAALMFVIYWRLGLMQYLSQPAQWPFLRYITSDIAGGTAQDEWFANRAMDLLTVSLPFVVFRVSKRPRLRGIVLVVIGCLAILLPLRRANLLEVFFASVLLIGIGRKDMYRLTRRLILAAALAYFISQCIFLLGAFSYGLDPGEVLTVSSTGLPEVRDLAWTLSLLNGDTLNGVTFVQALMPLPSIASDWSSTHSLRAISTKLIGADQTAQTGGLRLTIMGEAYVNFGYLGVMVICFLWGCAVAWCDQLLHTMKEIKSVFASYISVMCFVWICFMAYLAGTAAAAPIKVGALLLLGVAWTSRYRPRIPYAQLELPV
jgi:oligosaccharide repeat unit polymerase